MFETMNRRKFLKTGSGLAIAPIINPAASSASAMRTRPIPSSDEALPVIGLGTSRVFDVGGSASRRAALKPVLKALYDGGGTVVDSSPMYGSSEAVVGDLAQQLEIADRLFMASKVWTSGKQAGIEQMHDSMQLMHARPMDLMQVHNLIDTDTHLDTLREWKQQGLVRYIGITHYHSGGFAEMLRVMQRHELDFIQINYSILEREADQKILPLAQERGIATLINRPYARGNVFSAVRGKPLPIWATEYDCHSWGQFFLKFVLAHPAVSCVIPGTSKLKHMQDNLAAGRGRMPPEKERQRMLAELAT
ncbi:MAG: aldo/keto reductase [Gammaproteobacteria bacterium]|nr:aldo/keto reductase [Gammaproteobacteria bacterium]